MTEIVKKRKRGAAPRTPFLRGCAPPPGAKCLALVVLDNHDHTLRMWSWKTPPRMAIYPSTWQIAKSMYDWCCFYYFVRNSLVDLLETLCARIFSFRFVNIGFFLTFCFGVRARSLTKPFFRLSQPGSCAWLSSFPLCAECTCALVCVCLCMCMWKCVGEVINI